MINTVKNFTNRMFTTFLTALVFLALALPTFGATVVTSGTGGNWNNNASWVGSRPTTGDNVVISSGATITMSASESWAYGSITVDVGGILNISNRQFSGFTGVLNVYGTLITTNNNSTSALKNAFPFSTVVFHPGSSLVFARVGAQYLAVDPAFDIDNADIQVSSGTTLHVRNSGVPVLVDDVLIDAGGILNLNTYDPDFYIKGNLTNNGGLTNGSGVYYDGTTHTVAPTLTATTYSLATIYDANIGANMFTITLDFNEEMDPDVSPILTFPTGGKNPISSGVLSLSSEKWTDFDTYVYTYNVGDVDIDMLGVNIQVASAKNLHGVPFVSTIPAATFDVVLDNPEVTNLTVNKNYLLKGDIGVGKFVVTAKYSDIIENTPTLTFPNENPTVTVANLVVTGQNTNTIVFTYDVLAPANYVKDVDIHIAGGKKAGGVLQTEYDKADVFSLNTGPANVVSITPNLPVLSDSNEGSGTFLLTIVYDIEMRNVGPVVSFPTAGEDPTTYITPVSVNWLTDKKTCVLSYDVADVNLPMTNIDVKVEGAQETDGTTQTTALIADVFSVTTSVAGILYVNAAGGEDHTTISGAIAAATDGYLIIIRPGTYIENVSLGNKKLEVVGDPSAPTSVVIKGTGTGSVVVFANSAKEQYMSGLVIENGKGSSGSFANVTAHGQLGYYGGGVIISKATNVTLNNVIVRNNSLAYDEVAHNGGSGGGIYIADNSVVTITKCTITGNASEVYRGGGLCVDKSTVTATDVTITSNAGGHYGGGLAAYNSKLTFTNVSVSGNSLTSGDAQGSDVYLHQTTVTSSGGGYGTKLLYKSSGI